MATLINVVRPVFSQGVHYMTSPFGNRTYVNNGRVVKDHHDGVDLVAKYIAADYVVAFADGTVEDALDNVVGTAVSQGNYVKLRHEGGAYTVYYHLKCGTVKVKKGAAIKAGDVLGYMGSSGNSTGPHLHFGVMVDGVWKDPLPYLEGKDVLPCKKSFVGGTLDGVNIQRKEDHMVLYLKKETTGTNKWGAEVPIDVRGVVMAPPVYGVGNMKIPENGKVLSGHGLSGKWILENIKEGQLVWFLNNKVYIAKGLHRRVEFNCIRAKDTLVVYDEGEKANTNQYGYETAVDKNGVVLADAVYGKCKTRIPQGGFVVSGHGTEGKWMRDNVKKGSRVVVDKGGHFIKVL